MHTLTMPAPLSRAQSDAWVAGAAAGLRARGFGLWAVQERASGELAGCVGLNVPSFEAPSCPARKSSGGSRPHGDFDHPRLPHGHLRAPHVLYRLKHSAWSAAQNL